MAQKGGGPPRAEKDRSERWLLTYADLITLLLIFFIVLYSMSQVDKKKFEAMSQSLAIAFGGVGRGGVLESGRSLIPGDKVYKERLEMQNTEQKVRRMIAQKGLEGKISTDLGPRGLVISVKDTLLFTVGSADLTGPAREIIQSVSHILEATPNAIRVEGHTDNVPIHTAKFFSNWELSTARATNVLQYFIARGGIAPERLSAAGYGEYKPSAPNTSDRNRALNRRVDIVLLSSDFSRFEPGGGEVKSSMDDKVQSGAGSYEPDTGSGFFENETEPEEF
ncbi:MAG: flagellar motor protein MotB [Chitinispirillaceae bacterium]|nr:flagellar motor protein MotB [Chitinispirillaceae bacterium]